MGMFFFFNHDGVQVLGQGAIEKTRKALKTQELPFNEQGETK
jgi:hypothetical protein